MTNDEMRDVIYCAVLPNGKLEARYGLCDKGFPITTKYHRAQEPIEGLGEADLKALSKFKALYPTWWYKIGWCDVSRDFDCAPQGHSPEIKYIKKPGDCWDAGFSCDHKGTLADAIHHVIDQIENAKAYAKITEE